MTTDIKTDSVSIDLRSSPAPQLARTSLSIWNKGYHLKFPNLYRGEFALGAWFNGEYEARLQYPRRGQTNAIVLGLSESQLSDVFVKLTKANSTVLMMENAAPSIVIHPFMLIAAILDCFSEEDGMFINKSIDHLKLLQQKISANVALSMGNLSIELNQLSSDLRAIQMGNVYMQNLARVILASRCVVRRNSSKLNYSLIDLVKKSILAEARSVRAADEQVELEKHVEGGLRLPPDLWLPLQKQFANIINDLEALAVRCEDRKFDIECLQRQTDINLNVVSTNPRSPRKDMN